MQTETAPRIGDAVFVPCVPYQADIYDMDIDERRAVLVTGVWVRVKDFLPGGATGVEVCGGKWVIAAPAFNKVESE